MTSFFTRLFKRAESKSGDTSEAFAARFHRFKLFMSAYIEAYGEVMNFEERLGQELPFGMPFLRMSTARLTVATMQCVMQLNTLGDSNFARLNEPFAALRDAMQAVLAKGAPALEGPLLLSYAEVDEEHSRIVSPSLVKLAAIRRRHPEFLPQGFIVTGAAWWNYFNDPEMHAEIDRIMIISQEDSSSYSEASATIRERIACSFPLPANLEHAIKGILAGDFADPASPGACLLIRSMPVRPEHGALVMPEQVLRAPFTPDALLTAIRSAMAMVYRTRALIYRLKLGIRDRAMPLCVSVTRIPAAHARGGAHRKLDTLDEQELCLHVRRSFATPEGWPSQASVEGAALPPEVLCKVSAQIRMALECLADAPVRGNRHELFWAASEQGDVLIHGVNALPDPHKGCIADDESDASRRRESSEPSSVPEITGGLSAYPGTASGKAWLVRNFADALSMPLDSILILQQATPRWSFLLDFVAGAVAGDGTGNGLFARTARRYGRPTILRQPHAFAQLCSGQQVLVRASGDHTLRITVPDCEPTADTAPVWMPYSDIANMARELAPLVALLTLPDSDDVEFRAENCKTIRDILNYCQVHAVREMFHSSTNSKGGSAPAKQLVCDVPKQFWIINLNDGFTGEITGPVVHLEQITSIPMLALWEGFTAKPWDGPPQLNAKGFLSVLFEATVNPNLDPASQSTQYTEKNVFLIAGRFCSMRCRFGFHYLSMDCLLGERDKERFIIFQFKGGAANLSRRVKRVHFVAELLTQFNFATEIVGDTLTARLEQGPEQGFISCLRVLGYLVMHTRQLDMIMGDEAALAAKRSVMVKDMLALADWHGGLSRAFSL